MTRSSMDELRAIVAAHDPKAPGIAPALRKLARDPVAFAKRVLGLRLASYQRAALEAVGEHRRVAWRAAHGVGKTQTVAALIAWFIATHAGALVIVTAPTYRQVRSVVWRTLATLRQGAKLDLGGEFHDVPEAGWRFPDGRLVIGFAAADADRFAGFHAPNVLAIVDEASGVETGIYEALKGSLTSDSRLLLVGNPVRTSGEFYDAFNSKGALWKTLHTSAFDVPNVSGEEPAIPGLIDRRWIDDMTADYGEGSPVYAVRVEGNFPSQANNAVIWLSLVDAAVARYGELAEAPNVEALERLEIGVDPARFGDDESVIIGRRGLRAYAPHVFRGLDSIQLAARVVEVAMQLRRANERPIVRVDAIGIGAGVADQIRRHRDLQVIEVNAGASATDERYARCRDELWFTLRDWLRDGGSIPPDPKLHRDLTAPIYSFTPAGKIQVESKDSMRARLKRSPDRADALALAVYAPRHAITLTPCAMGIGPYARPTRNAPTDLFGRPMAVLA